MKNILGEELTEEKIIDNNMWALNQKLSETSLNECFIEYLYEHKRYNVYSRNHLNQKVILISGSFSLCLGWLIGYKTGCDETIENM